MGFSEMFRKMEMADEMKHLQTIYEPKNGIQRRPCTSSTHQLQNDGRIIGWWVSLDMAKEIGWCIDFLDWIESKLQKISFLALFCIHI